MDEIVDQSRELRSAFFIYCYGDHRDLHSFPTRRSSDHHPEPLLPSAFHEVRGLVGLPVRGGYVELVRNARLAQDLEGGLDTRLVALGADDDQHVGHAQAASSITL